MISSYKDLKELIANKGSVFSFVWILIINLIVFNFKGEFEHGFWHVLFSGLLLFAYTLSFIAIERFIDKQFNYILEIIGKNDIWEHHENESKKIIFELIDERKFILINYITSGLFIIDLISIMFYRKSVVVEIFTIFFNIISFHLNSVADN